MYVERKGNMFPVSRPHEIAKGLFKDEKRCNMGGRTSGIIYNLGG